MSDLFQDQLRALRAKSLYRKLREIGSAQGPEVWTVGQKLTNFSSNDYLGLANDVRLRTAAIAGIEEFGIGAGASRLLSGTQSPHVRLEKALADWQGTQSALCFSSGYAAAIGTIPALVGKQDVVLLDKLSHASLIDGARLSGAILRVFPHNHLGKLESHLEWARREHPDRKVLVATESIFSLDGDRVPLQQLIDLKKRFGAMLFLNEAHAIGVVGKNGQGLAAAQGLTKEVEVQIGTLSKALGVSGGYICGTRSLVEWLVNRARSFVFSTAPPPAITAAAHAAIEFLASDEGEKRRLLLWRRIKMLRESLPPSSGMWRSTNDGHESGSAIHPWMVGDEHDAIGLARSLRSEGFLVPAIRFPTVSKGSARLRITVTAAHEEDQIQALCAALTRHANTGKTDVSV